MGTFILQTTTTSYKVQQLLTMTTLVYLKDHILQASKTLSLKGKSTPVQEVSCLRRKCHLQPAKTKIQQMANIGLRQQKIIALNQTMQSQSNGLHLAGHFRPRQKTLKQTVSCHSSVAVWSACGILNSSKFLSQIHFTL